MTSKRKNKLNISFMCKIAGVSKSGYYGYLKRKNCITEKESKDQYDFQLILSAYNYKGWKKGARQIKMRLERDYGIIMNLKKIRRLMKKFGLVCPIRKVNPVKAMIKASQSHRIHENTLDRNFHQGRAKKTLLTDITYLTYGYNRRAYLSTIKDSSTKMILAYQLSLTLDIGFVIDTVEQLVANYKGELDVNVLIHSDQGCHYTSYSYQNLLKENGILQSMSRRGNCWDNAPQESFYSVLKTEMDLSSYRTYEQLGEGIVNYINYYNYDRPQWDMNRMTPSEYDEYLSPNFRKKYLPIVFEQSIIHT